LTGCREKNDWRTRTFARKRSAPQIVDKVEIYGGTPTGSNSAGESADLPICTDGLCFPSHTPFFSIKTGVSIVRVGTGRWA